MGEKNKKPDGEKPNPAKQSKKDARQDLNACSTVADIKAWLKKWVV